MSCQTNPTPTNGPATPEKEEVLRRLLRTEEGNGEAVPGTSDDGDEDDGEGVTAVLIRDGTVTVEFALGTPTSFLGRYEEAKALTERYWGENSHVVAAGLLVVANRS